MAVTKGPWHRLLRDLGAVLIQIGLQNNCSQLSDADQSQFCLQRESRPKS
jgi:hypothetical protein